ncbi:MAG: hypothetical protein ABSF09_07665 [Candidatus Bathyarchaeia archaeon]|jgi:hypothetical protein
MNIQRNSWHYRIFRTFASKHPFIVCPSCGNSIRQYGAGSVVKNELVEPKTVCGYVAEFIFIAVKFVGAALGLVAIGLGSGVIIARIFLDATAFSQVLNLLSDYRIIVCIIGLALVLLSSTRWFTLRIRCYTYWLSSWRHKVCLGLNYEEEAQ